MSANDPPTPGRPSRPGRENDPARRPPERAGSTGGAPDDGGDITRERTTNPPGDKADFGSLTRSSADLFKNPKRPAPGPSQPGVTRERIPGRPSAGSGTGGSPAASRGTSAERPRRYWRDSVSGGGASGSGSRGGGGDAGAGGTERIDEKGFRHTRTVARSSSGGGLRGAFDDLLQRAGGLSRTVLGIGLGVILALLVGGFLLNQAGNDSDDDRTPEPASENVFGPTSPSDGTEGPSTPSPESSAASTEPADPTVPPTEERQRGGDNRRNEEETQEPEGVLDPANTDVAMASSPVVSAGDGTGAPTLAQDPADAVEAACPVTCLLRVAGSPALDATLAKAGTRPSFAAERWSWVVASAEGSASIGANAGTTLVTSKVNTLNAYVVRMPEGSADDTAVEAFGTILDKVDRYRVVEVAKVPALVTPLTDNGYEVFKMAPAPVPLTVDAREKTPLANIDIGELLDEVDRSNLEATVRELQGTSATDGSGVGTRFYSLTGNAIASEYLFQRMEAIGMKVWYEDFLTPDGLLLVNIVGEVAGSDPSQVYGMLAHLDSIATDVGTAPGADDNATGMAATLEIARILAGYDLTHPVRLVFVNAEEVGILGTTSWARQLVADEVPMEGVFNVDAVGSDRQGKLIWLNSDASSAWMTELIVEINNAYGLGQELATRQNPAIVADDNKVRDQGIAAVMVARELYGMSSIHHTSDDLIGAVSFENTQTTTQLVLLAMATLVQ
ncbi:MAG: M28 family peptidase [Chloroflexia bacterium]|nr:M28 family peptidase [Chloroflexia bacterium]